MNCQGCGIRDGSIEIIGREMEDWEHVELLEAALRHKGPLLISGYKTELYNTMLSGWHREETVCLTQAGTKK